ncbi:AroB-related putative sugar phosphate phospholyase (cyclizing) [Selenomonas ruminantium]|uniref:3-dehydroquinate synthase n=1 Tax=Selenomonas ruminantium TaxID=971 RepID=A0A1H0S1Y1_SELRU|nr:AroB-related putative sugar phosphate phospholyase (cyclizing) [Selenomonas ruminantium]SDP35286.1 3-dehydroquinate synthase [Selenomonas ruminantium]
MIVHSKSKNYEVHIVNNLDWLKGDSSNRFYVLDRKVYEIYKNELFSCLPKERMYLMDAREENKTIYTALDVCAAMTVMASKRNTRLVSIGGGIVQDVTGFAANILYRGIAWTFVPTTLLSACDSCIGGKTSLNYDKFKNLLGTFYPPDEIYICSSLFKTLEEGDFLSGLGEVVKFNVMGGDNQLASMEKDMPELLQRAPDKLLPYVKASLEFKKNIIEEDEFDKGTRVLLNYGHTFGHAIEAVTDYAVPHGTAVAMGMVMANRISLSRCMISEEVVHRIEKIIKRIIPLYKNGIDLKAGELEVAIHKDKKQIDSNITAILMNNNIDLEIVHDIQSSEIKNASKFLEKFLSE